MKLREYLIRRWLRKLPEGLVDNMRSRMIGEAIQDKIADTHPQTDSLDELAAFVCGLTGVPPSRGAR